MVYAYGWASLIYFGDRRVVCFRREAKEEGKKEEGRQRKQNKAEKAGRERRGTLSVCVGGQAKEDGRSCFCQF